MLDPDPGARRLTVAERVASFWPAIHRRLCTRIEPSRWGEAHLSLAFGPAFDGSFLRVTSPAPETTAALLHAEAERLLGGAGLSCWEIVIDDDALGARLAAGFERLGYEQDPLIAMVHCQPPSREVERSVAREVDLDQIEALLGELDRGDPHELDEAEAGTVARYRRALTSAVETRFFSAFSCGRAASACTLLLEAGAAQIQDVGTIAELRGRGLASAVILHAVEAAHQAGCDLVHVDTSAESGLVEWYRTLGFVEVLRYRSFLFRLGAAG